MRLAEVGWSPQDVVKALHSTAVIYEALYRVRRIGFYRVMREIVRMGVRKRTATLAKLKLVSKLDEGDVIGLRLDYYIHLMKLRLATVYIGKTLDCEKLPQVVPFLRSCINLIPMGTLLTLYYPESAKRERLEDTGVKYTVFYERVFREPDLKNYASAIAENPSALFAPRALENHLLREMKRLEDTGGRELEEEILGEGIKARVDNKDLAVIKVAELNPLTTKSFDVELGVRGDILKKHVEHAEKLLRGIRVRRIRGVTDGARLALFLFISGKDLPQLLRVAKSLLRYPTVSSAMISEDKTEVAVQILSPADIEIIKDVGRTLRGVAASYGLEFAEFYIGDMDTLKNYTVPFIREREYSPLRKGWLVRALTTAIKYIKKG